MKEINKIHSKKSIRKQELRIAKNRSLFKDGFISYTYLITLILFGILGYLNMLIGSKILNIPTYFYFAIVIFILVFSIMLFVLQFKTFKLDFYSIENQKMRISKTKTILIYIFNLIYSIMFISFLLLPLNYIIKNYPVSEKIIIKNVTADCRIFNDDDVIINNKRFKKIDDRISYYFELNGIEEEIKASYNNQRVEEIRKNNYKQKLKLYLKRGYFGTYILQKCILINLIK